MTEPARYAADPHRIADPPVPRDKSALDSCAMSEAEAEDEARKKERVAATHARRFGYLVSTVASRRNMALIEMAREIRSIFEIRLCLERRDKLLNWSAQDIIDAVADLQEHLRAARLRAGVAEAEVKRLKEFQMIAERNRGARANSACEAALMVLDESVTWTYPDRGILARAIAAAIEASRA